MKKLVIVTGIVLIFMLMLNAEIIPALAQRKANNTDEPDNTQISSQSQTVKYHSYVVKEYNGKIAVFEKGSQSPYRTTDMYINFLPEYDKALLSTGIEVDTQAEVNKVLEDYIS